MGQVTCIGTLLSRTTRYKALDVAYERLHRTNMDFNKRLLLLETVRTNVYGIHTDNIATYGFGSPETKASRLKEQELAQEVTDLRIAMNKALAVVNAEIKEIKQRWGMSNDRYPERTC